jgi:hypothetical protein
MKQSPEELALAGFFFTGKLIWFQKLWKSIYLYISSYIHYLFVANGLITTNIRDPKQDNYRLLFLDNKDKFEDINVVIRSRGQTIQLPNEKRQNDKQ